MQYAVGAQGVAINNSKTPADKSAMLDISSATKGLLIPRIASLTGVNDKLTIPNPAKGLLIYTGIMGVNGMDEGFYYNSGKSDDPKWEKLAIAGPSADWSSFGNTNTNPLINYIGTSDDKNLVFKRNKEEVMQVYPGGAVVFTGNAATGTTPVAGAGSRMMWMPEKGAFRGGTVTGLYSDFWDDKNIGENSFAAGIETRAVGKYSTAFGFHTSALADRSTTLGSWTYASGRNATAMGYMTDATGYFSTAMGRESVASGDTSTAMGYKTVASGNSSTAMGNESIAGNNYATAMGVRSKAMGITSTAMGLETNAIGNVSTSMGVKTNAIGKYSATMGEETIANAVASLVIGRFNKEDGNADIFEPANQDLVFQVGNGTKNNNRNDALSLKRNGDMVIAGKLTENSDIRLKEDIEPLSGVLGKIAVIQPITYYFKDKQLHPSTHQIGFSAQEIQKQFPQLVDADAKGYLSVSYTNMAAVLMQAVKEQQTIIETQQTSLQQQQQINEKLNAENTDIKTRLEQLEKIVLSKK